MSDKSFELMLATPAGWGVKVDAESLVVPSVDGYLGILANHAPLMTAIGVGSLTYRDTSGYDHIFAVTDGFLEVSNNVVTIICDAAEENNCIEIKRAEKALERAKERLSRAVTDPDIDTDRARAAYQRAVNRLKVAQTCDIPEAGLKKDH